MRQIGGDGADCDGGFYCYSMCNLEMSGKGVKGISCRGCQAQKERAAKTVGL